MHFKIHLDLPCMWGRLMQCGKTDIKIINLSNEIQLIATFVSITTLTDHFTTTSGSFLGSISFM